MPLVLQRKPGESVEILASNGERIRVTVSKRYRDGSVRLIFSAPKEVIVHRQEVWDEQQQEPSPPAV